MFNCKEVSRRVSESMDHRLPLYQRLLIRMHLLMCRYCARFRRQVMFIRELCRSHQLDERSLDTTINLPTDARERIRQAVKSSSV
jgi:hypothetical protein